MKVLGVDPGTSVTGFGVVAAAPARNGRLIECGVLRPRSADSLPLRLKIIHEGIRELLGRHRPDVVAVEGVFYGSNARTTVVLGHARGVILLAAAEAGLPVVEYSPAMIKKAVTGRGAALKPQVGFMVARLLQLSEAPKPADAADGVAVALTHLLLSRRPAPVAMRRIP
ncbi:MAG TPA: crossover junction endodeoxyribonuclease RuvC [Gemmatimonadales bacterium]|nr:crossover junction endodeoxyribonuclease RuvC [Gemmatimonadales bacterium]